MLTRCDGAERRELKVLLGYRVVNVLGELSKGEDAFELSLGQGLIV